MVNVRSDIPSDPSEFDGACHCTAGVLSADRAQVAPMDARKCTRQLTIPRDAVDSVPTEPIQWTTDLPYASTPRDCLSRAA